MTEITEVGTDVDDGLFVHYHYLAYLVVQGSVGDIEVRAMLSSVLCTVSKACGVKFMCLEAVLLLKHRPVFNICGQPLCNMSASIERGT